MKKTMQKGHFQIGLIFILLISMSQSAFAETGSPQNGTAVSAYNMAEEGDFIYITGDTTSIDGLLPQVSLDLSGGLEDIWLVKLRKDGTPVYAAIIGGSNEDTAYGIAVKEGVVYLLGETWSTDFPGAPGNAGENDVIILALAADGSQILWSRRLGGSDQDSGRDLALLGNSLFITGITWSQDFVSGAAKGDADGFIGCMDLNGGLNWLQVFGGRGLDAPNALVASENGVWVAGQTFSTDFGGTARGGGDAFVTSFDLNGTRQFSGLFGGRQEDIAFDIITHTNGDIYIFGATRSAGLPDAIGSFTGEYDAILMQIDGNGALKSTTYLGGTDIDYGRGMVELRNGDILLAGSTFSPSFPAIAGLEQNSSGAEDAFLVLVNADGEILSAWLKGSPASDRAIQLSLIPDGLWVMGKFNTGDLPYALFIPAQDLQGVTLPAVIQAVPTATIGLTATSEPTETSMPVITETQGVDMTPSTEQTTESVSTSTETTAALTAPANIKTTNPDQMTSTTEAGLPADPKDTQSPLAETQMTDTAAVEDPGNGSQSNFVPLTLGLIAAAGLAGFLIWSGQKKLKNKMENE